MLISRATRFITTFLSAALALTGCARNPHPASIQDPYEKINRSSFRLNMAFDSLLFRPLANTYKALMPNFAQKRVSYFFDNFGDATTAANDVLQGKLKLAVADSWRVMINSTLGIGGLFDPASKMGLSRHYEDFGLTLAYWGAKQSAFLILPVVGPSTFRDGIGKAVDLFALSPWRFISPEAFDYDLYALYLVDIRTELLPANVLIAQSFDPYIFIRNAYLQNRDKLIAENARPSKQEENQATVVTNETVEAKPTSSPSSAHPKLSSAHPVKTQGPHPI